MTVREILENTPCIITKDIVRKAAEREKEKAKQRAEEHKKESDISRQAAED